MRRGLPVNVTVAEAHAMVHAAKSERDAMLIEFSLNSGGRVSEVIQTRVGDVDAHGVRLVNLKQGHYAVIRGSDGKPVVDDHGQPLRRHVRDYAEKHVKLRDDFLRRLQAYTAGMDAASWLFPSQRRDGHISRKTAWEIITAAAAAAGVYKRHWESQELRPAWCHCLRHGLGTALMEAGVPVAAIAEQLGHASLASTQVYTRVADPRITEMINRVAL